MHYILIFISFLEKSSTKRKSRWEQARKNSPWQCRLQVKLDLQTLCYSPLPQLPPLQKTLPQDLCPTLLPVYPRGPSKSPEVTKLVTRLMGHLFQRPSQGQTHEAQSWKKPQRMVLPSDFQTGPQDFRGTSSGPHLPGINQYSTHLVVYIKLPCKLASEGVLVA